jgi:hypothetical protein
LVDLLLLDGWEYSGLTGPPENLNIHASKHAEPQKWRRWRRKDGAIYLQVNGSWSRLDGDLIRPLESGSALKEEFPGGLSASRKLNRFLRSNFCVARDSEVRPFEIIRAKKPTIRTGISLSQ